MSATRVSRMLDILIYSITLYLMTKSSLFCHYKTSMSLIYIYPHFFSDPSTTLYCAMSYLEVLKSMLAISLHTCINVLSMYPYFVTLLIGLIKVQNIFCYNSFFQGYFSITLSFWSALILDICIQFLTPLSAYLI